MIKSVVKKIPLYAIFFIILFQIYPHVYTTLQKINYNLGKIETYSRHEYEARIYGYLAERYMAYWFNRYTKPLLWPVIYCDIVN